MRSAPIGTQLGFPDGRGQSTSPQNIPNAPALLGADACYQWSILDDAGAYVGAIAFSDALRIQVGR